MKKKKNSSAFFEKNFKAEYFKADGDIGFSRGWELYTLKVMENKDWIKFRKTNKLQKQHFPHNNGNKSQYVTYSCTSMSVF